LTKKTDPSLALPRLGCTLAAVSYATITALHRLLYHVRLPYRAEGDAVIYLMWSGSFRYLNYANYSVLFFFICTQLAILLGFSLVLARAILPSAELPRVVLRVVQLAYRNAVALPLFALLSSQCNRYIATAIYALARFIHWDVTPILGQIEAGFLTTLQRSCHSAFLSQLCSVIYSFVWFLPLLAVGPILVAVDEPKALSRTITGLIFLPLLAIPFFVLLPTFDPWTMNPLYGNTGPSPFHIFYLFPHADVSTLTQINRELKWATGSCLPSLHVAFPLMLYWIMKRSGLRALSWTYFAICVLNSLAILYLGVHWFLDIVVAVPYTYAIVRLVEWLNWSFALPLVPENSARNFPLSLEADQSN
jgi:hypothetical protein